MLRAAVLNPQAAKLQNVYWWWQHSLSGHMISFQKNIAARVLPGRGKIIKHWPVRCYKRVGDHYLSVYLSNTYCRYKSLLGTPIAFSVLCSLWKIGSIFLDVLQTFCELLIKGDFELLWFPERSHSSTNKNSHFLDLEKVNTFVWYTKIVTEKLGYLNKWRRFGAPYMTAPQTPGLDPPQVGNHCQRVTTEWIALLNLTHYSNLLKWKTKKWFCSGKSDSKDVK